MSIRATAANRLRHCVSPALTAVIISGAVARAQDQPAPTPPSQEQTQPSQEQTPPPAPPAQTSSPPSTPAEPSPPSPPSLSGTQLPQITVRAPVIRRPPARIVRAPTIRPPPRPPLRVATPTTTVPPVSAAERLTEQQNSFDQARSNLFTTVGTTSDTKSHETIEALPQGTNAVERMLLQAPGVSQDSAASGLFHVRNDHANAQYRINGILLPDGVSGFGSILDTNFIGGLSSVTGALPAEYGLRTTGIIDLTTRKDIFNNSGSINYYFGSRERIEPSFEYGGTFGVKAQRAAE